MTASGFRSSCEASSTKRRLGAHRAGRASRRTCRRDRASRRADRRGGSDARDRSPRSPVRRGGDRAHGPHDAARDGPTDGEADRHQHEERRERVANLWSVCSRTACSTFRSASVAPASPLPRARRGSCRGSAAAPPRGSSSAPPGSSRPPYRGPGSCPARARRRHDQAAVTSIASRKRTDRTDRRGDAGPATGSPTPPRAVAPPTTVSMGCPEPASASLRRRLLTVTRTVFVNGSARSSQTCSSRRSGVRTSLGMEHEVPEERELLGVRSRRRRCGGPRVARRRARGSPAGSSPRR